MSSLRNACCMFLMVAAARLAAADPPPVKEPVKDKEAAKDIEKAPPPERIVSTGRAVGTINSWNDTDGKLTLHIKTKYLEPNQQAQASYASELQNLMVRQQNAMTIRNPLQRQQEMIKVMRDAQNLQGKTQNFYQVKEKEQNVDLELAEEVKIRRAAPPPMFDDKGNPKKYTAEELKDLKGMGEDAKLPGYTADRDSLRNGQTIMVTTGYLTGGKPPALEAGDKKPDAADKKADPDAKKTKPTPKQQKVILIVILAEPKN